MPRRVFRSGSIRWQREWVQPNEDSRRKAGQKSKCEADAIVALDPVVFSACHGNRQIGVFRGIQRDADFRIFQYPAVPGSGPVVGRNVEPAVTFEASHDSVVRRSVEIRSRDDDRRLVCGLEMPEHGLEEDDDSDVDEACDPDDFCGFHSKLPIRFRSNTIARCAIIIPAADVKTQLGGPEKPGEPCAGLQRSLRVPDDVFQPGVDGFG